jgi:hypothetical protein
MSTGIQALNIQAVRSAAQVLYVDHIKRNYSLHWPDQFVNPPCQGRLPTINGLERFRRRERHQAIPKGAPTGQALSDNPLNIWFQLADGILFPFIRP